MTKRFAAVCLALLILLVSVTPTLGQTDGPTDNHLYLPIISRPGLRGFIGPWGGSVFITVHDYTDPNIVYAGSYGAGVYKSTDGGLTWTPARVGMANLYVNSMAIDPSNPAVLYVGTNKGGIYKSTNAGQNWVPINNGIQAEAVIYAIAIDPINPSQILIGTRGISGGSSGPWRGVLYKSTNGGTSWTPKLENIAGPTQQDWIYAIAWHPLQPGVVLAASHQHGPFYSINSGESWTSYCTISAGSTSVPGCNVDGSGRGAVFTSANPSYAFYGVWHRNGIYRSPNGQGSWTQPSTSTGDAKIHSLTSDPHNGNVIYANAMNEGTTNRGGVWRSTNNGASWSPIGLQSYNIYNLSVDPFNSNRLFASVMGIGIMRSDNGGATWVASYDRLSNPSTMAAVVRPGSINTVYAAVASSLQVSDELGNWTTKTTLASNITGLVMSPTDANTLFALTQSSGLRRVNLSSGSSANVTSLPGLPEPGEDPRPYPPVDELEMLMPGEPEPVEPPPGRDGSGGVTPEAIPSGPLYTMVFAPGDPNVAYVGGNGVSRSGNGGGSFGAVTLAGNTVVSLAVDPANANLVYAAISGSGTIKRSANGASSWTDLPVLPDGARPYALAVSLANPGVIFAGTTNGIYQWDGSSWSQIGLAGAEVTALAANPVFPGRLVAGTRAGAAFSIDDGATWLAGPAELNMFGIVSINIEPRDGNYVYYATNGSGVYMQYLRP